MSKQETLDQMMGFKESDLNVFKEESEPMDYSKHILHVEIDIMNTDILYSFMIYKYENEYILQKDTIVDSTGDAIFINGDLKYLIDTYESMERSLIKTIGRLHGRYEKHIHFML